jgi:hypothetical protein
MNKIKKENLVGSGRRNDKDINIRNTNDSFYFYPLCIFSFP